MLDKPEAVPKKAANANSGGHMYYYHLTWDVKACKHCDVVRKLVKLLCDMPFNVKRIGRPIESTMVFKMPGKCRDIETVHNAIRNKFKKDFDFIVSRVSRAKWEGEQCNDYIKGRGIAAHEEGFEEILKELRGVGDISKDVINLKVNI